MSILEYVVFHQAEIIVDYVIAIVRCDRYRKDTHIHGSNGGRRIGGYHDDFAHHTVIQNQGQVRHLYRVHLHEVVLLYRVVYEFFS